MTHSGFSGAEGRQAETWRDPGSSCGMTAARSQAEAWPVVIVGGGPVGLFLALCLVKSGIRCRILEKRASVNPHSRSIGIHPVSLELLDELGIVEQFLICGLKIRQGHAFADKERIGTLSFSHCPPPFPFILSLPQNQTEEILIRQLEKRDPGCLVRCATVRNISRRESGMEVTYLLRGEPKVVTCRWLVGCDGKNSIVRKSAGIGFRGREYPDTYLMGDFSDTTSLGEDAAIYLHRHGLIESFPLPDGLRRWVVKTDKYVKNASVEILQHLISERTGIDLSKTETRMVSSFGVQNYLATSFNLHRCILAGDSAHVLSPIGGQGMNLGWITASSLAAVLKQISPNSSGKDLLNRYSEENRRIARQAARRAGMNMWLGRKHHTPLMRSTLAKLIVNSPLQHLMSRIFTMRGLGKWPV